MCSAAEGSSAGTAMDAHRSRPLGREEPRSHHRRRAQAPCSHRQLLLLGVLCILGSLHLWPTAQAADSDAELALPVSGREKFLTDYSFTWGEENLSEDGSAVLAIRNKDQKGGGFSSRQPWIHGVFKAMIKMPAGASCGVVSAFYLTSEWNTSWPTDMHDEIDFEILGDDNTGEIQLQTNYFVGGKGGHEERLRFWFDPTLDFHEYKFIVSKDAVRWYVDGILVREITAESDGGLPKTSQFLVASIWDGSYWVPCTYGRKDSERVMDYAKGPFELSFKNVSMDACYWRQMASPEVPECANPKNIYVWDEKPHRKDYMVMHHLQQHYTVYHWTTWNTTSPERIEAPEERTAEHLFDLVMDDEMGGRSMQEEDDRH